VRTSAPGTRDLTLGGDRLSSTRATGTATPIGVSAATSTSPSSPLARGYIPELDGLRGIAILLVIVHHFWPATGYLVPAKPVVHLGWMGVDLFFVISGFLITGILLDTRGQRGYFRNYLARRMLRVFPLYYLFVITAFLVIPAAQPGSFWQSEFVQESGSPLWYLLYLGNVREAITGVEPAYILAPLWSLSIEEQFYLVFPLLVAWLDRRALVRVLVAMVILAPVFRALMLVLFPDNVRIQYLATPSRMDVLALGGLLAVAVRSPTVLPSRRTTGRVLALLVALCACVFVAGGLDRTTSFARVLGYSLIAFTFTAFVTWTLQGRAARDTAWLRVRPLLMIGKLCYGIYLLQRPAEVILIRLFGVLGVAVDPESLTLVLLKMLFAFGVAAVSWHLLERPLLRLKDRFVTSSHPRDAEAIPTASETLPTARAHPRSHAP
jgi:peptidoglycan/LPS O-acetylase OafA/YrhL